MKLSLVPDSGHLPTSFQCIPEQLNRYLDVIYYLHFTDKDTEVSGLLQGHS